MIKGVVIEKGGVNFFVVYGELNSVVVKVLKFGEGGLFFVIGVLIVLYFKNFWVFIIYMNVWYFEMDEECWWFGGGIDLMLYYVILEDV